MATELQSRVSMRVTPHQAAEIESVIGPWGEVVPRGKSVRILVVHDCDAALDALTRLRDQRSQEASGGNYAAQPGANSLKLLIDKLVDRFVGEPVGTLSRRWG